jgi:hypothetical protein
MPSSLLLSPGAITATVAISRLQYRPTSAAMETALAAYLDRAQRVDPHAADVVRRALADEDISRIYRSIVGPFGLHDGNVADSFAAYVALGWMIANNEADLSLAAVRAVRDQFAIRLVTDPSLGRYSPEALGEEFKLSFVILHSGWQSARHDSGSGRFADGVAKLFERQGLDLRSLRLTSSGLEAR